MNQSTKLIQKFKQKDNFCYRKVGRAKTEWGAIEEKYNIAIAILKKLPYLKGNKNYLHFDGSNNIFVDCRTSTFYLKYFFYYFF